MTTCDFEFADGAPFKPGEHPVQGLRILVADDDEFNQQVALRMLNRIGHSVALAGNGLEAVDAIERQAFDLVLMDVQMPEMGGLEATAAIREREKKSGAHLPIIALTAHVKERHSELCIRSGMDGFISKPIRVKKLFAAIESLALYRSSPAGVSISPSHTEDVFDWPRVLARSDNDLRFVMELASLFLEESALLQIEIESALARGDSRKVERAAHTLRGSLSYFGAQTASRLGQELEMMGREGDLTAAEITRLKMEQELTKLESEMSFFLSEFAPYAF